jgi:2-polyprenyl-3-methyl-5-hydroxy-6-metoxy-1,4-benzoquinol methylase
MKKIDFNDSWPPSWQQSYSHDLLDIYGGLSNLGYVYQYANRRKQTLDLVQKVAQPGARVLDVAAAQGNFSLSLAEMGYEVTWNDLREDLVDYVKLKYEYGTIHYKPGNIFELKLESCFDVVLITEIIEHVAHPDEFLAKIAYLVKPGGYIIMSTPNGEYFRNHLPRFSDCSDPEQFEAIQFQPDADGHIFLLHLDEIESLAHQAGLLVVETRLFTNFLTRGALKSEALLRLLPYSWVNSCEQWTCTLPLFLSRKIHLGLASLLVRPNESENFNK